MIDRPDQLEAIGSPARREVIDAVQLLGECSIAEIAEVLGRPADSLYYHVRKLMSVGVLNQTRVRRGPRRDEALYDLPARPLYLKFDPRHPQSVDIITSSAAAALRQTERTYRAAVEGGEAEMTGEQRNTLCMRVKRPLTPEELERVNGHIDAIMGILSRPVGTPSDAGDIHLVTLALAPEEAKPVSRRGE